MVIQCKKDLDEGEEIWFLFTSKQSRQKDQLKTLMNKVNSRLNKMNSRQNKEITAAKLTQQIHWEPV